MDETEDMIERWPIGECIDAFAGVMALRFGGEVLVTRTELVRFLRGYELQVEVNVENQSAKIKAVERR